jgi:hypothetical protein
VLAGVAIAATLALAGPAQPEPLLFGTTGDGDLAVLMQTPDLGLPAPAQVTLLLPLDAAPHGLDFLSETQALIADFGAPRVYRVRITDAQWLDSIALPGRTSGNGTLAVAPDGSVAVSAGSSASVGEAVLLRPPWGSGAVVTALPLPGSVPAYNTQAVAFAPGGRFYVCHSTGISAFDPPYSAPTFTRTLASSRGTVCVISRDGARLYAMRGGTRRIDVFDAPLSTSSATSSIAIPADAGSDLAPMVVSPDRTQLLIGQVLRFSNQTGPDARLWRVRDLHTAPVWNELTLPDEIAGERCEGSITRCPGFEDASLSADGRLAVFTGQSVLSASTTGRAPALFVRDPFDDALRAMHVVMPGDATGTTPGRGAGAVRFPPVPFLLRDGFESP